MKISISYRPGNADEEQQVRIIHSFFKDFLPSAKVRVSRRHDPYLHIYWSTKKAETPCNSREKT